IECIGTNLFADPDIKGFVLNVRDITERRRAEEALRQAEQKYQHIFESAVVGIYQTTPDGQYLTANPMLARMFGYDSPAEIMREVTGNHLEQQFYVQPGRREEFARILREDGVVTAFESEIYRRDGSTMWISEHSLALRDAEGQLVGFQGMSIDITNRRGTEVALRESEEKYRSILENIEDGYFEVDLAGNFTFFNDSLCRILGYPADELMGMSNRQYMDQENAKEVFHTFNAVYNTGTPAEDFDWGIIRKDGTGRSLESSISLRRDAEGGAIGFRGIVRDITDRKRAEEERHSYAAQLQRSNRELQDFAFVASHDLQEPLRKVQAFGDRLKSKYGDGLNADGRDYLERMQSAAGRMQTLINDLLTFSRVTTKAQPFTPVNLHSITREVLSDLEVKIEETGATMTLGELPTIDADPVQM
ncbi:MAG: PAS domain S-box protein, partial [Burkholderiaceae bacterium]